MYDFFYRILPCKKSISDDIIYLLNEKEISYIKKCERLSIAISAFIGGIMVIILYVPQYIWPKLFSTSQFEIPILKNEISISVSMMTYGIFLVFIEIFLLMLLNIYCCHEIAICTGFIDWESKKDKTKKELLIKISREAKTKEILNLGINPLMGLSKTGIFILNLLYTLKATLTNFFVRLFLQKIMGRFALRVYLDMAGIPIFAFWNAIGTRKILIESRVIIMGINYIEYFEKELINFRELSEMEKTMVYDTLQYIAVSKRDYHRNHFILSHMVLNNFKIAIEKEHPISNNYFSIVEASKADFKKLIEKLIILGLALDGKISRREKNRIIKLNKLNILSKNPKEMKMITNSFVYGKGLV